MYTQLEIHNYFKSFCIIKSLVKTFSLMFVNLYALWHKFWFFYYIFYPMKFQKRLNCIQIESQSVYELNITDNEGKFPYHQIYLKLLKNCINIVFSFLVCRFFQLNLYNIYLLNFQRFLLIIHPSHFLWQSISWHSMFFRPQNKSTNFCVIPLA